MSIDERNEEEIFASNKGSDEVQDKLNTYISLPYNVMVLKIMTTAHTGRFTYVCLYHTNVETMAPLQTLELGTSAINSWCSRGIWFPDC